MPESLRLCFGRSMPMAESLRVCFGEFPDTPESFRVCLGGLAGSSGKSGTSMIVADNSDLGEEDPELDLFGFGRTMASCGDEALFKRTFFTTGWPFFPSLVLGASETDFDRLI